MERRGARRAALASRALVGHRVGVYLDSKGVVETPHHRWGCCNVRALLGTGLAPTDLTTHGGAWMPILEPVVDLKPSYEVLGCKGPEVIWSLR